MGFSKKSQAEANLESDKKWVIAGISIRASLKPIATKQRHRDAKTTEAHKEDADEATTPTAREARIAAQVSCPPAPRKRRTPVKCHVNGGREFFNPPDLELVFKLGGQVERAN